MSTISITGAREHNLKNIDITIPRNKLTTLIGVSGSGKSTIAFDIIYAEGQRQYLESISSYIARMMQRTERPNIDTISGLSSTIMIEQRRLRGSPRSTVGTTTELYSYLRLLFSRIGSKKLSAGHFSFNNPLGACEKCKGVGYEAAINVSSILDLEKTINEGAIKHTNYQPGARYFNILKASNKVDFDKKVKDLSKAELDFLLYSSHIKLQNDIQGFIQSYSWEGIVNRLMKRAGDTRGISDTKQKTDASYWTLQQCSLCLGARLNADALAVKIQGKHIGEFANLPLTNLLTTIQKITDPLAIAITTRMTEIIQALIAVGIGYVSLHRSVNTLSGGEAQRIKLARELGSDLIEMIYILDEPTAGLHPRDTEKLIGILKKLRDAQNTVIVVEHDADVMRSSDHLIEIGPKAGKFGGEIVAYGTPHDIMQNPNSITGTYLLGTKKIQEKTIRRQPKDFWYIRNANIHNLKNISVAIPLGIFTAITGVSGSGKSSLIMDVFAKEYEENIVMIDQSPVGVSSRATIATYSGILTFIRNLIAEENKVSKSLFSSNSKGACPECEGLGYISVDMHFMADMKMTCETCDGKKFTQEVLQYYYKGKNMYEILNMTTQEAVAFFADDELKERLQLLIDVGLDYLELGQTLDTLSGGEAQRLKLASRLHKKGEFYILDEPTSGLHFADIHKLVTLLHQLVDNGNTVLVIEHNFDVIKSADWVIDLGPEGGDNGGEIVAQGTPEAIMKVDKSYTGKYLQLK